MGIVAQARYLSNGGNEPVRQLGIRLEDAFEGPISEAIGRLDELSLEDLLR
jgi:hypothetical protein